MIRRVIACFVLPALVAVAVTRPLSAQSSGALSVTPNLADRIGRPLHYAPEGDDFVIVNGGECFNRPLYGGNLRAGLRSAAGAMATSAASTRRSASFSYPSPNSAAATRSRSRAAPSRCAARRRPSSVLRHPAQRRRGSAQRGRGRRVGWR